MSPNHNFCFHALIKKRPKNIEKTLKNDPQNRENRVPNGSQTKTPKKQPPKSIKSRKITKNVQKWGPQRRVMEVTFSSFLSIGVPLGTHMAPRASKRGPMKPPSLHFASFWHPFSHIFASFYTFCSHIFATNFLHFLK